MAVVRRDPPGYLTAELGERPSDQARRKTWDSAAPGIESWRMEHGVTDRDSPLGPRLSESRAPARKRYRLRSVEDDATFASLSSAAQMGDRNHEDRMPQERRGAGGAGPAPPERQADRLLAIVQALNADKAPTQRGGGCSTASVAHILENPVYAGLVRDGDRPIDAEFEAIISRELYFDVQRLRKARKQTHRRGRGPVGQHLFRQGFLRHADCDGGLSPRTHRNKNGTLRETYRDNTHYYDPTHASSIGSS